MHILSLGSRCRLALAAAALCSLGAARLEAASVSISPTQIAGPTPFIQSLTLTANPGPASVRYVSFRISPAPGSQTRAVYGLYSISYLSGGNFRAHSYVSGNNITLPVFGLYDGTGNTVLITTGFIDGTSQQNTVTMTTPAYTAASTFRTPNVLHARLANTPLSYDFIYVKGQNDGATPIIIDTDGKIRWIGTNGVIRETSPFDNACYNSTGSGITRIDFDGVVTPVKDYSGVNLNYTGVNGTLHNFPIGTVSDVNHHNIDPGKTGILLEANTTTQTEAVALEVDKHGNILHSWNFAGTIAAAMEAGGDDPTQLVTNNSAPAGRSADWFHNNSLTYRASDDTLVVSGREQFVMGIDYTTGALKWILGDTTKLWHTFKSLQPYTLALQPTTLPPIPPAMTSPMTLPPIGEHGMSIVRDLLLLFDDDTQSFNAGNVPAGGQHLHNGNPYSATRKYVIDAVGKTATEVWNYNANFGKYSNICSSVYEDRSLNFLIDYSTLTELLGLDSNGNIAFDYNYSASCNTAFNAVPFHFENMRFN